MKALAVLLYALGNVSQGMIAKLLGVSHVAVYKWVRAAGEAAPAPSTTPEDNIVQIDEMWHFVNGKKTRFGSGEPSTLWHGEPWPGSWVGVMTRLAGDCSTRSASKATSSSPTTARQGRRRRQRLRHRRLGGLPPAHPGGTALRRQGPDLPDRAGQRRRPPPPRPLPPPLQGHLACAAHGRRGSQAALPPPAARELPAATQQLSICLWLSVSRFRPGPIGLTSGNQNSCQVAPSAAAVGLPGCGQGSARQDLPGRQDVPPAGPAAGSAGARIESGELRTPER